MFPLLVSVKINWAEIKLEMHMGTRYSISPSCSPVPSSSSKKSPSATRRSRVMAELLRVYMQVFFRWQPLPSPDCIDMVSRQRVPLQQPADSTALTEKAPKKRSCLLTQDSRLQEAGQFPVLISFRWHASCLLKARRVTPINRRSEPDPPSFSSRSSPELKH